MSGGKHSRPAREGRDWRPSKPARKPSSSPTRPSSRPARPAPAGPQRTVVGSGPRKRRFLGRLRGWRWKRILLIGFPSLLLLLVAAFFVTYARTTIPEPNEFSQEQSTVVRYADGSEIGRLGTNRKLVELSAVSEAAQKAVLSAEDRGFYSEPGISPKGIARALFTNVRGGGTQQGGSTITQQYAKNAFLTQERTYTRKVKEIFISLKMTRQRSKEQILQDYLNTIYFGRGAYGIESASQAYFGTTAAQLSPQQGAVLAALIQSPSQLDPLKNPARAKARYVYVLDGMLSQGWLNQARYDVARKTYPTVLPIRRATNALAGPEGTVVRAVMNELKASGSFTEEDLERGGLDIRTTLNPNLQKAAVAAIQDVTGPSRSGTGLQGALVAVAPGTGQVKAYYGGANGQGIDYAAEPLQPGSSMKAYTVAAALEEGIPLTARFSGRSPQTFPGNVKISNFGGSSSGRQSITQMTENSTNTAFYALAEEVGADKIADLAYRAGVSRTNTLRDASGKRTPIITLGAYPIRPIDQAAGFATFAARGRSATPFMVSQVRQGGEVVYEGRSTTGRAFDEDVADDATYALEQVVQEGSGTRAQLAGGREAAGKTGTTSENKAIWFAGYTPQLAASVWFGYGTPKTITIDGVGEATGGRVAAAAWADFMDPAMEGQPEEDFAPRAFVGGGRPDTGDDGGDGGSSTTRRPRTSTPTSSPSATATSGTSPSRTPAPTPTRSTPVVTIPPVPTAPSTPSTAPSAPASAPPPVTLGP